jgi:riboflavin synthase
VFTGIVEEMGDVVGVDRRSDSAVLSISASKITSDLAHGASIAVSGVCLTVTGWQSESARCTICFDVMAETLERSVIGALHPGDVVNLERAARVDARLGGHIVQGHVDGTGVTLSREPSAADADGGWERVRFGLPRELARYVAEKGSVAVDGVSLTVIRAGSDWFEVGLIPETLRATTLGSRRVGDAVNLEVDVLAKYVARLLDPAVAPSATGDGDAGATP